MRSAVVLAVCVRIALLVRRRSVPRTAHDIHPTLEIATVLGCAYSSEDSSSELWFDSEFSAVSLGSSSG